MDNSNIKNQSKRLQYIDVAKGILIIMMMAGHCANGIQSKCPDDLFLDIFQQLKNILWVPYFMPTFFVITGLCSNFNKEFKPFIVSCIKTIKVPAVLFGFTFSAVVLLVHHQYSSLLPDLLTRFVHSGYWFLDAMFISKILYWFIHKLTTSSRIKLLITSIIFLIASYVHIYVPYRDYFYINHALFLTFFICLGDIIKNISFSRKHTLASICIYMFSLSGILMLHFEIPFITNKIQVNLYTTIPLLLLSSLGSLLCLWICKSFPESKKLNLVGSIGKNSLIYYCLNVWTLKVKSLFFPLFGKSLLLSGFSFVLVMVIALVISSIASRLINTKYLSFYIGKF